MNYNKYSKDVHNIIDNLSKEESNHIGNGYWVDSDHIIYRKVEYMNNKPIGFIDVYSLPKFKRYGLIIIAVSKDARGKGIGRKLVNSAIQNCKNNKDIDKLRWKADSDNLVSINMAKSLGFRLINNTEKEKEFIYDLKDNDIVNNLCENINESAINVIGFGLISFSLIHKAYNHYLQSKFDKENFESDLVGFKKLNLSMLTSKKNNDGNVEHPDELINILEKYDKQIYEKYKDKRIIICKCKTTINNQLIDPFFITVLITSTDDEMIPIDFKYIPIHSIARKYQEYYILNSYFNVIYHGNINNAANVISIINRKYPKVQEFNNKYQEYIDSHNITKKHFTKKKSKETDIKESTLSSKERNELDDDLFGIPSLRKYPLNDKEHVLAAIRMFNRVDRKHEKELAHNILKSMKKYKISTDIIGPKNRLQTYIE